MSIANITIMLCKNQEELVEKYKKGGGELEKERKELIEMVCEMNVEQFQWFTERALELLSDKELQLYLLAATLSN